jgi:thiamine biosynthesis lipoprotein
VRVEIVMGTTVTLDIRKADAAPDGPGGPGGPGGRTGTDPEIDAAVDAAFAWLHEVDARFSTYRPESEISRIARGELPTWAAGADVQEVMAACEALRIGTDGAFDASRCGPDGSFDPSGYVKGWALERAAERIAAAGLRDFALNGGGDLVARGHASPDTPWRVGIRHPSAVDQVAAVIAVSDLAVATSGDTERGAHIVDPRTGGAPVGLRSVTVVGPSLALADVYATAVFVMGVQGAAWLRGQSGYDGCLITTDERLLSTPGFEALRVEP